MTETVPVRANRVSLTAQIAVYSTGGYDGVVPGEMQVMMLSFKAGALGVVPVAIPTGHAL